DPLDRVVECGGVHLDDRYGPTRVSRQPPYGIELRWFGNHLPAVEGGVDPGGDRFPGSVHGFLERVAGREAAGEVWYHDAKGRRLTSFFDQDRIVHHVSPACLRIAATSPGPRSFFG